MREMKAEEINLRALPGFPFRAAGAGRPAPRAISVSAAESRMLLIPFAVGADGAAQVGEPHFESACRGFEGPALAAAARAIFAAGARVALSALPPDSPIGPALAAAGFTTGPLMARMERAVPAAPPAADGEYIRYAADKRILFAEILYRTIRGSLDAPEIPICRDPRRLMMSFEQRGAFDPADFALTLENGEPAGILLLSAGPDIEITYLGVVPEFRARGLGARLIRRALARAAAHNAGRICAFVDTRNAPAIALYAKAGFSENRAVRVFVARPEDFSKKTEP